MSSHQAQALMNPHFNLAPPVQAPPIKEPLGEKLVRIAGIIEKICTYIAAMLRGAREVHEEIKGEQLEARARLQQPLQVQPTLQLYAPPVQAPPPPVQAPKR